MELKTVFFKIILAAVLGWLIIILAIWMRSGNPFWSDAHLIEFNVCLTDTAYNPVEEIPIGSDYFYLCGKVVGPTGQPGSLLVRHNNRPFFSHSSTFGPGVFFQKIKMTDRFVIGEYEAIFAYSRQQLASVIFTIQ
jgi:hypothetical protein